MKIRKVKPGDGEALYRVFTSSIVENGKEFYSDEQLHVWAHGSSDIERSINKIIKLDPFVVVVEDEIVAYGDLQSSGYIDHFFVRGGYGGRGIGSFLMRHIINEAKEKGIEELSSNVSLSAQGLFKKFGFTLVKRQKVDVKGIILENAHMIKKIDRRIENDG